MTPRELSTLKRLLKLALDETPSHETEQCYYLQWAVELAEERQKEIIK